MTQHAHACRGATADQLALDFLDTSPAELQSEVGEPPPVVLSQAATATVAMLQGIPDTGPASGALQAGTIDSAQQHAIYTLDRCDLELIELWLDARCPVDESAEGSGLGHAQTRRQYHREATRFALWLRIERRLALSQATLVDCIGYRSFLANPLPAAKWCAPRATPRSSPAWRPLEGPLSQASIRQALVVLRAFYSFLVSQGLTIRNPWTGLSKPRTEPAAFDASRSLTCAQWLTVRSAVDSMLDGASAGCSPRLRQLRWVLGLLQATGLRLAEVIGARVGDLRWHELDDCYEAEGTVGSVRAGGWIVEILGKGGRRRRVPVPVALADELAQLASLDGAASGADRAMVVRWRRAASGHWRQDGPLGAHALYMQIRQLMARVSVSLRESGRIEDADALQRATTHWLRHTFATHAVASGVPLDVVQASLGHASLSTTSHYVKPELARRVRMTQTRFFAQS